MNSSILLGLTKLFHSVIVLDLLMQFNYLDGIDVINTVLFKMNE